MHRYFCILALLASLSAGAKSPQRKGLATIDRPYAEKLVRFLSDDSLLGRAAGTEGCIKAGNFIAAQFEELGLEPLFDGSYFQPFSAVNRAGVEFEGLRNICGAIPGRRADELVVVGAHYDHLGYDPAIEGDGIYNGADDNASGVQAVIQIARAVKKAGRKPERTIIFALWDGEEKGLLGSKHFLAECGCTESIKAAINFDMIGRDTYNAAPGHVVYFYSAQNPAFGDWIRDDIATYGLCLAPDCRPNERLLSGSDNASFVKHGIPFVWYHTDGHPDYHKPSDHPDGLNWDKMLEITKAAFLATWHMASEKEF
ncbi:MAG: M20/M25/M40 family metallo-hydrolase [Bacteroidales bacterium]|nr:M20/M25/M40 family metallo-hydrolase [Bacteroidales bacterium]